MIMKFLFFILELLNVDLVIVSQPFCQDDGFYHFNIFLDSDVKEMANNTVFAV